MYQFVLGSSAVTALLTNPFRPKRHQQGFCFASQIISTAFQDIMDAKGCVRILDALLGQSGTNRFVDSRQLIFKKLSSREVDALIRNCLERYTGQVQRESISERAC
jgi:hypothetical protein